MKQVRMLGVLAAGFLAFSAFAGKTCTWTGAQDGCWTNAANWAGGEVPGVLWDGTGTPASASGDTAVFGACSTVNTNIDCTGLYSVRTVWIRGADTPAYVFGNANDTNNLLAIEASGAIVVDADVPEPPQVAAGMLANSTYPGGNFALTNLTDKAVVFTTMGNIRLRPGSKVTDRYEQRYYLTGKCTFRELANIFGGYARFYLYRPGPFVFDCDVPRVLHVHPDCTCELEITKGHMFAFDPDLSQPGVSITYQHGTITFSGEGLLKLAEHHTGSNWQNQSYFTLNGSTGVTIDCPVTCISEVAGYETPSIHLWTSAGVFTLNSPSNAMPGYIDMAMTWAGPVTFPSVACLGTLRGFRFGSGKSGASVETTCASDETFTQALIYTNSYQYTVRNAGAGTLTVASELYGSVTGGVATAAFEAKKGPIVFASTFSASGAPGAVRFTGTKGVMVPSSVAIPSGTAVQLMGGQTLAISGTGDVTWPFFENVSGKNSLAVPTGANLTIGSLSVTAGTLDIVTPDPTVNVFVSGMTSASPVPVGLTKNGQRVIFDDNGRMLQNPTAIDVAIAAKGDAVPNAPTQKVGITAEGSGENTGLAADATAVKALVQQAAVAATIAVTNGQVLTADEVAVDYSAASLTIGASAGTGMLSTSVLRNDSPVSKLTADAPLAAASFLSTGVGEKSVRISGAKTVGTATCARGTTKLADGFWETANDSRVVVSNGATLVVGGTLASQGWFSGTNGWGRVKLNGKGVIRIPEGGIFTNRFDCAAGTIGAFYLEGGTFCGASPQSYKTGAENPYMPGYCHVYYGVSSGIWVFRNNTSLGSGQHYGVITQRGGSVIDKRGGGSFRYGMGSSQMTDWYLCGDSTFAGSGLNIGDWGGYNNYTAILSVDGEVFFDANGAVQMAYWNGSGKTTARSNIRCILNLNGKGVFRASTVNRNGNSYASQSAEILRATDKAYVNFNGGTFRVTGNGFIFGSDRQTNHVDRVTLFEKGARIDTYSTSWAPEIAVPLEAPTGMGVAAVAWNDELTGIIAAPIVKIVGSGEGATAHALLDEASGKVTNIVVTCRGWGYGADTYANVCYGYNTTPVRVEVTLAPNVSGGLTVIGGGTLQLSRTNTYAGATCVSNATLALNCPDAIDAASKLVLEKDGKLDLRNNAQTFADIETRGGTVQNGLPRVSGLTVDFAESAAGRPKAVDLSVFAFTPGAALTLANFDAAALEPNRKYALATFANGTPVLDLTSATAQLPEGWKLLLGPQKLRLVPVKGMVLIVR